jgi:hypothetical protein
VSWPMIVGLLYRDRWPVPQSPPHSLTTCSACLSRFVAPGRSACSRSQAA